LAKSRWLKAVSVFWLFSLSSAQRLFYYAGGGRFGTALNPRQRRTRTQRAHCGLTRTAPLGCADAAPVPPQVCSEYPCAVSTSWLRHAVGGGVGNNILPAIPELHAILTSPTGPSLP